MLRVKTERIEDSTLKLVVERILAADFDNLSIGNLAILLASIDHYYLQNNDSYLVRVLLKNSGTEKFTENIHKVLSNEISRCQKYEDFKKMKYLAICLKHLSYLRSTSFDLFLDQITLLTQATVKNSISTPLFLRLHT